MTTTTTTRTVTVRDHEAFVRTVTIDTPDVADATKGKREAEYTAITGGRRTAALTVVVGVVVVVVALLPAIAQLIH